MTSFATPWLVCHRPDDAAARLRLLCFPSAGGSGVAYRPWLDGLPREIDACAVQLPGRQTRLAEPPITNLDALVNACASALSPLADLPWALFGHSFGALVAFELARLLRDRGAPPCHLFVAALSPPHRPPRQPPLHDLTDRALIAALERLGGTPPELLVHRELLELSLPALRADLALCKLYRHRAAEPLACPVSTFGGADDPHLDADELSGWRQHTRGLFRLRMMPGGHFFLGSRCADVLAAVAEDLEPWTK